MIYHRQDRKSVYDPASANRPTFADLQEAVDATIEALKPHTRKFDSIVVTGVSGMCVGFPAALALKKPIMVLRKKGEDSHNGGGQLVNHQAMGKRVLFLDDFVSGGLTQDRCIKAVEAYSRIDRPVRVIGRYLYKPGPQPEYGLSLWPKK